MKPIEPGCLALLAYAEICFVVTVIRKSLEETRVRCEGCGSVGKFWITSYNPAWSACQCILTRIDGHEEPEETVEAIGVEHA